MEVRVPRKLLLQRLLHRELLRADEGREHDGDRGVDVLAVHVLAEAHGRPRLGHANDGLDVTDSHRHALAGHALPSQLGVNLRNLRQVSRAQLRLDEPLAVRDVLLEHVLGDKFDVVVGVGHGDGELTVGVVNLGFEIFVRPHVRTNHESRQSLVEDAVDRVLDDAEDIEARQDGIGQFDVVRERPGGVVPPPDRVRGRHDGAPRLQRRHDARLGDGDGLLLHRLVDGHAVLVVHLVELVDEADAPVGHDQGTALQNPLARHRVLLDSRGETDG